VLLLFLKNASDLGNHMLWLRGWVVKIRCPFKPAPHPLSIQGVYKSSQKISNRIPGHLTKFQ